MKDKNDNDILADDYDGMNNLTEDDSYTVSASIKAKSGDGGNAASATGKVNVFKPELTYKDSTAYYGDTARQAMIATWWAVLFGSMEVRQIQT